MFPSKTERVDMLVKFIEKVKTSIKIEAGELFCEIYNEHRISEAFRKVADKITIKVQCSPVFCVDEKGYNSMVELWKEGRLKLYIRKVRGDKIHRWIGDDCFIYSEDFHEPVADLQERRVMEFSEEQERYWAMKANGDFDSRIEDKEVEEVTPESIGSVILLTPSVIKMIRNFFSEKGEDYNYKTKDEIENVLKQLGMKIGDGGN